MRFGRDPEHLRVGLFSFSPEYRTQNSVVCCAVNLSSRKDSISKFAICGANMQIARESAWKHPNHTSFDRLAQGDAKKRNLQHRQSRPSLLCRTTGPRLRNMCFVSTQSISFVDMYNVVLIHFKAYSCFDFPQLCCSTGPSVWKILSQALNDLSYRPSSKRLQHISPRLLPFILNRNTCTYHKNILPLHGEQRLTIKLRIPSGNIPPSKSLDVRTKPGMIYVCSIEQFFNLIIPSS